jgi:transposase
MPTHSPRTFAREFKIDLCRQVKSGQKRPAQICREHQLTEGLLLRWRREYEQRGDGAFSPKEVSVGEPLAQKIAELERFCGQLSLENSILKKALDSGRRRSGTP